MNKRTKSRHEQERSAKQQYHIRSVERALGLLRSFFDRNPELSIGEIIDITSLDRTTAYRILSTLESNRFVEQDPKTGKYRLGVACLELGSQFLEHNDIRNCAQAALESLRQEFGETVHLAVLDNTDVVYLEKLPSLHAIGFMSSKVGGRSPAHCTGVGKALLAFLLGDELNMRYPRGSLERYTDSTITNLDKLRLELRAIKESGYAVDSGEHEREVKCVAVPIFDHLGIVAAMSLSGPVERMNQHIEREGLIQKLVAAGIDISTQMGWHRDTSLQRTPKQKPATPGIRERTAQAVT